MIVSCQDQDNEAPLTLQHGEMLNELHENHVGEIAFMETFIPFSDFSEADFQSSITMTGDSELSMRMFLKHTLTHYMSALAPDLPVNELCNKGNFQFRFLVDGKEVYVEELNTGAGGCQNKNSMTVYGVPLIDKEEPDHWGRFMWMRFFHRGGGKEALSEGNHQLTVEVRPYVALEKLRVGTVIAKGTVEVTPSEVEVDPASMAIQAIQPTDQWTISTQAYDTTLIQQLNAKIAQNYFKQVTSIAVVKDGELLIEEYFNEANRKTLHDPRSVGKTMASSMMGIAIGEGHIKNEGVTLDQFYDLSKYQNDSKAKRKITLKSLLTMSSGVDGTDNDPNSPGNEEFMYPTDDWVKFALDLKMDSNKTMEESWDYFTAGVVVLGDILHREVPGGLVKYADQKLLSPLGIQQYKWQFTPTNVPNTAGGFQLETLGFARWGQTYLDGGKHKGKQVIPANWVEQTLTKQVPIPGRDKEYYGYLFFNKIYQVGDQSYETFYMSGNGGNKVMVFKDHGLVIILTATAYGQPYMHVQGDEMVEKYLLPAVLGEQ